MDDVFIKRLADDLKIPMIGFIDPAPLTQMLPYLEIRKAMGRSTNFEGPEPKIRIDYKNIFPQTKTVIVIGIPYVHSNTYYEPPKNMGLISSIAWGEDYHLKLKNKMRQLVQKLLQYKAGFEYKCYVDNPRLLDRGAAWKAGLGFFGKNNLLINPVYGSYFNIGQILLDYKINFETVSPIENKCKACVLCVKSCPNGALENGYTLIPNRCISYLTQKKNLSGTESVFLKKYLYGCDICQVVCPFNFKKSEGNVLDKCYCLDRIEKIKDKEYKIKFGKTSLAWCGKDILIRNAQILKCNYKK